MKIEIELHEETHREAERLSRSRCLQGLAATLGNLAADLAECHRRPGSWEASRVTDWLESHYPPVETLKEWRREDG
jgi:hypothetical protein